MTQTITQQELHQNAARFIDSCMRSGAQAWPRIGRDLVLADEDTPAGSLLFTCHTNDSMSNPLGIVHGGVIASLMDTCMGVTCAAEGGKAPTPTITMTVNYARPVPLNADVQIRAHIIRCGATSGQMRAEIFLKESPDEILATATGVYSLKRPRP